jgi:glucuronate isomerase
LYDLRVLVLSIWTQGIKSTYRREYWSFFATVIRRYRGSPTRLWMGLSLLLTAHHFVNYSRHVSQELARDSARAIEASRGLEFAEPMAVRAG